MSEHRLVVIGAAGEMVGVGLERLAFDIPGWSFDLYDLDMQKLEELANRLPAGRTSVGRLDLFDGEALRETISGASLVLLGAGPYMRTAPPVMRACLEAGVDYVDFGDDTESTLDALRLDGDARASGVALRIGCGASPGLSNLLAVDAARQLDHVESIDVCWVSGDEGPRPYGAAVVEHVLHIGAGPCLTWRDGAHVEVEAFVANEVFPMAGDIGDYRLYETPHPETVTLPRRFPDVRSVRVMGGAHPQPVNGAIRGVALAAHREQLTVAEAVTWFQAVMNDEPGSLRGWRFALAGMLGQVRRGESSLAEMARYLWRGVRKDHEPYRGCISIRAVGTRDGESATVEIRTPAGGPDSYFASSMRAVTGTCLAAFVKLAIEQGGERRGTLAPEDWVSPGDFYRALQSLGVPPAEILDPATAPGTSLTADGPDLRSGAASETLS